MEQSFNIAWFKLAECVTKGEKERALAMHKLLSHSIESEAFTLQIEADLLCAFKDKEAENVYEQAAYLYIKNKKLKEALFLYKKLITLFPNNRNHIKTFLQTCYNYNIVTQTMVPILKNINIKAVSELINEITIKSTPAKKGAFYEKITLELQKYNLSFQLLVAYAQKAIECYVKTNDKLLTAFLTKVAALNKNLHKELLENLKK